MSDLRATTPDIPSSAPTVGPPAMSGSTGSSGWYETRQALQKEMQSDHDSKQTMGGVSLRAAFVGYLVMTLVVMIYEGTYIILYFVGAISDDLAASIESPDNTEGERAFLQDLQAKQAPWLLTQLSWYGIGVLFCFFGFAALYTQKLALFKIFQVWLFAHIFAYFVTAVIFEQFSPIVLQMPLYVTLNMFIALVNVYAGHVSMIYKRQLIALDAQERAFANAPVIGKIESPV